MILVAFNAFQRDVESLGASYIDFDELTVFEEAENGGSGLPQERNGLAEINEYHPFYLYSSHPILLVLG
jgi:hypothetical protein